MNEEVTRMLEKIDLLESELVDAQSKLRLSIGYAEGLEEKINMSKKDYNISFSTIVFIVLIISLFILKLKESQN